MVSLRCFPSSLSAAACWMILLAPGCSTTTPVAKEEASKPVPVKTVSVTQREVPRTTTQPATVHPYYRAELRARVSGYVQEVRADIGDFVEQGAVLAVIDVPELDKQRQVLEARIGRHESEEKRAQAEVQLAEARVRSAEAKRSQARSELRRAEASLAAAEAEFSRTQDLVERRSLESRVLDEVRKKRDSERANEDAVASAIDSAEADVAVAVATQSSAQADLEAAQAETAVARRQLEEIDVQRGFATLTAPFAGLVTSRALDPGDLVRETSEVGRGDPLFVVSQIDTVRVHVPVPEVDAALVNRGDEITLSFPSFSAEEPRKGTVTRIAGDLDPSTRSMLVEAVLDNPDRRLIPGMFGQASITLSTKVAANMLPARAIRFDENGQAYVYVLGDNHTVSVVPVTTGIDDGHSIEVLTGVEAGQQVVDAHLKRFQSGQRVAPVNN